MSKSRGNVVNPDDIGREYGADAANCSNAPARISTKPVACVARTSAVTRTS